MLKQQSNRTVWMVLIIVLTGAALMLTACPTEPPGDEGEDPTTYTVTYDGNGAESGNPPTDDTAYEEGAEVTVLGNTGGLAKSGYTFDGWNTADDGSGDAYAEGGSLTMGTADVTLYASWEDTFVPTSGKVASFQKISDTEGGFTGTLDDSDRFGSSVCSLGDLDGDGVADIAVGANFDDGDGFNRGAVWMLFLNTDGTVKAHQKISDTEGGFTGTLDDYDYFGSSVCSLGDLDGDGVVDLAVGASEDGDGGSACGAVWILFLNTDGTVKGHQKISDTDGGFTGTLDDFDYFGNSVCSSDDLDGDGIADLAVGAYADDDGGGTRGAVWVLFLNTDGTVKSHQKISDTEGGFTGILDDVDSFGSSITSPGDLDGDGDVDLAVGAYSDSDGGTSCGAVWVLFMNTDGTVKNHQKISATEGGFSGILGGNDWFGWSVTSPGDLDGDGICDLAVGANEDEDGGIDRGAVWVLFLNSDGTVKSHQKISDTEGAFTGILDDDDNFGSSICSPGDLDGDSIADFVVGANFDDDGGGNRGAVWVLFLDAAE